MTPVHIEQIHQLPPIISGSKRPKYSVLISPNKTGSLNLPELWRYRSLLYFFCWRDLKVRYKQTVLGASWALVQPLFTVAVFSVVFGKVARIPSENIPYPLFSFAALIPWTYFSGALGRATVSIVSNGHLISKIYFPRLLLPLASILPGAADFSISILFFFGFMFYSGFFPSILAFIATPVVLIWTALLALGSSLWLGTIHVKFRDIGHALPFFTQLLMYVSPIIYPTSFIPEKFRWLLLLNPLTGILDGFRSILFSLPIHSVAITISLIQTIVILLTGIYFFQKRAHTFADII